MSNNVITSLRHKEFYSRFYDDPHRINFVEWGDELNENVIFCVHGLTRNSRDFDIIAKELSKSYRVICPDIIGRGKSQWVDQKFYNYETYVQDILGLLDHLKINKVNWLGSSMGGIIGMMISSLKPKLIKKMCLNDIGPFIPHASLTRIAKYVGANPKFDNLEHAESHMRVMLAQFGIKSLDNWRHMALHGTFIDDYGDLRLNYDPKIAEIFKENVKEVDLSDIWRKVEFEECLVLRGAKSDVLLPEKLDYMLKTKKNIHSITFDEAGHVPALMEKEQLDPVVKWFVSMSEGGASKHF